MGKIFEVGSEIEEESINAVQEKHCPILAHARTRTLVWESVGQYRTSHRRCGEQYRMLQYRAWRSEMGPRVSRQRVIKDK